MSRRQWLLPVVVLATTTLTALAGTQATAQDDPDKLVIGFVPSVESGALVEDIQPLAAYLTEAIGIPVEGFVSSDYAGLVTAMDTGQAHIAALPPFGLIQAADTAGAEMILQSARNGRTSYHTQFMTTEPDKYCLDEPVENERAQGGEMLPYLNCNGTARVFDERPDGPIGTETLTKVEPGTNVSFVEPTSASGFIFPATVFATMGIDPEADINSLFAGSHDASVIAVCSGQAEVGVSFDDARSIVLTDCDVADRVVVFAYGPEIPNDGVAVAGDLSDQLKADIKQALLDYAASEEGVAVLVSIYNISAFGEPNLDSYQIVRDAVEQLGYGS